MASLGHVAVGMAGGRLYAGGRSWRAMVAFSALSLLPDLDVVTFAFGVPYASTFGHRGASHALLTAALLGGLSALLVRDRRARARAFAVAALVAASHGLLDAMTTGGEGVALLWPFDDARIFFGWRPIPVAPIGAGMLSPRGLYVVLVEALLFSPLILLALWPPRRAAGADP